MFAGGGGNWGHPGFLSGSLFHGRVLGMWNFRIWMRHVHIFGPREGVGGVRGSGVF